MLEARLLYDNDAFYDAEVLIFVAKYRVPVTDLLFVVQSILINTVNGNLPMTDI